jgi:hypothetical protein
MNNGRFVQAAIIILFGLYGLSTVPNKDPYFPILCFVVGYLIAVTAGVAIPSVSQLSFWWYRGWNIK